jgi:hypothetical protein
MHCQPDVEFDASNHTSIPQRKQRLINCTVKCHESQWPNEYNAISSPRMCQKQLAAGTNQVQACVDELAALHPPLMPATMQMIKESSPCCCSTPLARVIHF